MLRICGLPRGFLTPRRGTDSRVRLAFYCVKHRLVWLTAEIRTFDFRFVGQCDQVDFEDLDGLPL